MTPREFADGFRRHSDNLDQKNKAVNDFLADNPDLGDDDVYGKFLDLQNEAAGAAREYWEYFDNNRGKVVR